MIPAPIPANEAERLASLQEMAILSTPRDSDLDRITRTVRKTLSADSALVSLIDANRQWFKSRCGLDASETGRDISFCGHAIHVDGTFIIPDALKDERFHDNPLVTGGPKIRFYAGQPLTNAKGFRIGTLCVLSSKAKQMSAEEQETLEDMGHLVEMILDQQDLGETQKALIQELDTVKRDAMIDSRVSIWNDHGFQQLLERELARAKRETSPVAVGIVELDPLRAGLSVDEVAPVVAGLLTEGTRKTDLVARIAPSRFAVAAYGIGQATLPEYGEKLHRIVRNKGRVSDKSFSVSIGLMSSTPQVRASSVNEMIASADEVVRTALAAGGNQVKIKGGDLYAGFAMA